MVNAVQVIYQFFNHPFFVVVGGVSVILILLAALINFVFWLLGIWPLLWRLGFGRWVRKISVVANTEAYNQLEKDLIDSGIFRKDNISQIPLQSLTKIKDQDLLLVHYQSFNKEQIKTILRNKKSHAGMIFYYPEFSTNGRRIPDDMLKQISSQENTTVVNFRGRLLNDIITTLITTSYEKR